MMWSAQQAQYYSPPNTEGPGFRTLHGLIHGTRNTEIDYFRSGCSTIGNETQSECQDSPNVQTKRMNKNKRIASSLV